ncbi:VOC family protein [Fluviispira vulneris]|uniref:VOC family protein n=1 Tax=Fluviispira vulneris TaxID=2763012 RepID=UPI001648667F|nr:VOC family protein [Fluviispira vulneris]
MHTAFFVSLSVKDLDKSKEFFSNLGFSFDSNYTYENAICMIIGKNCYVMLINEPVFKKIVVKELCDPLTRKETYVSIAVSTKEEVDDYVKKAIKFGATEHEHLLDKNDYSFMYVRGFSDLDGHLWMITYFV